mmetsp:Transcript_43009/g.100923  ORF Transcript_43009/g.100923 Transcript_43009/m.100923 type:complete len:102 (-) Transcript_43009:1155-1460(-)|eukprot:CAMPEP_0113311678 /NCGR_PEP_ID=MMETSP0010_2-20120614/8813_1 /TAXON_ID=216773 ORGANISM="Corethron hystrix, Strain 308" /NCGR_SAMPLE_ID=MMETSP0010_2 /ASSEMBLY_ACC=CAM_ASM_000155 /LENGTH=101 /DNA_ID=CAMNT_0000167353 /DNA_START=373 /DNA_END=678 /DNA_ORIENTATION=+ /assembly_acc=CAM_ASM_000155
MVESPFTIKARNANSRSHAGGGRVTGAGGGEKTGTLLAVEQGSLAFSCLVDPGLDLDGYHKEALSRRKDDQGHGKGEGDTKTDLAKDDDFVMRIKVEENIV